MKHGCSDHCPHTDFSFPPHFLGDEAHKFKWQNFSIEWESVVLSMSLQPKRYTLAQSLGKELFIILGSIRREEASLTPACLSLESYECGPGPLRRLPGTQSSCPSELQWA